MNFSGITAKAVVDWIELKIETATPTNFQTVRRVLSKRGLTVPYTGPIEAGKGGSCNVFVFKIHDPKSAQQIKSVFDDLGTVSVPFQVKRCAVIGVEVALDVYLPGGNRQQLAALVADLYRFSHHVPADRWHLYRRNGETPIDLVRHDWERGELTRLISAGWQLTDIYDRACPIRVHAYLKDHDYIANDYRLLPVDRHRARYEITLRGAALPFDTLDGLAAFDFRKLAQHFKWQKLADDLRPGLKVVLGHWVNETKQFGRRGQYQRENTKKKLGRPKAFRSSTQASPLNEGARDALDALTNRWRCNTKLAEIRAGIDLGEADETSQEALPLLAARDSENERGDANSIYAVGVHNSNTLQSFQATDRTDKQQEQQSEQAHCADSDSHGEHDTLRVSREISLDIDCEFCAKIKSQMYIDDDLDADLRRSHH